VALVVVLHIADLILDIDSRCCGFPGQFLDFVGNHRKTLAGLTSSSGL